LFVLLIRIQRWYKRPILIGVDLSVLIDIFRIGIRPVIHK
jgi:hypothetical protein